jgi:Zn-dependent membrane protease YugP
MIALGVILLIVGFILSIPILWTIGIVLAVVGAAVAIVGGTGRRIGGRAHWY